MTSQLVESSFATLPLALTKRRYRDGAAAPLLEAQPQQGGVERDLFRPSGTSHREATVCAVPARFCTATALARGNDDCIADYPQGFSKAEIAWRSGTATRLPHPKNAVDNDDCVTFGVAEASDTDWLSTNEDQYHLFSAESGLVDSFLSPDVGSQRRTKILSSSTSQLGTTF